MPQRYASEQCTESMLNHQYLILTESKNFEKQSLDETRIVMHGASGVEFDQVQNAITAGCSKVNYYSYMAKATTKFVADKVAETDGKIAYHELQEAAYEFMKGYDKRRNQKRFKNGK